MFYKARTLIAAAACLLAAAVPARATNLAPYLLQASTGSATFTWANPGGNYTAVLSTSSSFTTVVSSASIAVSTANYPSLAPDTTYYFKVKITAEPDLAYSQVLPATATWVAAPGGIYSLSSYFTAESSYTAIAKIGWNTGGNPEWTNYDLAYSTDTVFAVGTLALFNNPQGAAIDVGGLYANTTYYFKVRARGVSGTLTAYTPSISTATLALKLSGLSDAVYETSSTVSWTMVNGAAQAEKSAGYTLGLYINPALSVLFSSWTTAEAATSSTSLSGLTRNTTYYYRAGALNLPGAPNLSEPRSFTTLAAVPQNLVRLSVADYTATLGWTALPAGTAMGYRLEASTTNFAAGGVPLSSVSYRTDLSTLTLNTLDPNTTYYFRVGSVNSAFAANYGSSVASVTLALPVSEELTDVSAAVREVTASFTPFQDFWQAFSCEGYRLEGSTAPFGTGGTVFSSVTYTYQNQLRTLTLENLAANTTYYLRLGTLNWQYTPNYTVLPSTKTGFPEPPAGVALANIWSSSASINFTPGIASGGHVAEASVYRFFSAVYKSSATSDPSASNLVIEGLDPNTTYYFRAGALYNGTTIYNITVPDFRQTLTQPLTGLNIPAVFQSSVTVAWTPLAASQQSNTAESYLLEASTGPGFASPVSFSSVTYIIGLDRLTITGLAPNTSYYFRAGTLNSEGSVNYAATPATATLANPPVESSSSVSPFTMTFTWLTNSNPSDTRYLVELYDDPAFTIPEPSSTTVLSSATFSGLTPNTTYYPRLTSINRLNRRIPAVDFSPTATGAHNPTPLAYSGIGVSSVTLNWGPGSNALLTTFYQARVSSSSDFSGTNLSSVTLALSAAFTGLLSNTSYYLSVSALNLTSVPTDPPVSLGTALTLPATAYILSQAETYSGLMLDGFTVNWADNGNSSATVYRVDISTLSDFSVLTDSKAVQAETCSFSNLLLNTNYWARVQARGQTGLLADFVSAGFTHTLSSSNLSALAGRDNIIFLDTSYGQISVQLPAGSIGSSTVLTLKPSTSTLAAPLSAVSRLTPTGIGVHINHFPSTLVLKPITITIPYRLADLPPGTDRARLVLALFDETNSLWVPLSSVSDTVNNRVIGQTWHLSTFQIMQAYPEAGLSDVKVYPNPYRPNSVSDVMHFTNMTPYAKVRLYTFLGELVRELKADGNGMAHWDGLNKSGLKTASGVYIAFVQTKDKKSSKSFKVAVER
ncbi:MAG: fibronectin type III domain-containing protein [Elusimicrobiota bacterium]|nr:fibronectin type III domain-containing protein [Elusimicrobiota bacterium]